MPTMSLGDQLKRRKPIVFQHKHHQGEELARNLSTFQLMMFGVGATVGTGVFFVLGEAVPKAGPAVLISFLIAGLAAGLSALCYAELASAIPVSGSTYSYAYHAMGELVAVVIAGCVLLEYGVATGAVAVGWSGYFNELLSETIGWRLPQALSISPIPGTDGEPTGGLINLPAVVLVLLCMVLLIRGASESARVNAIMVLIKLGVLILFAVIGFTAFDADHFSNFFGKGLAGVSAAAGTIFFSFPSGIWRAHPNYSMSATLAPTNRVRLRNATGSSGPSIGIPKTGCDSTVNLRSPRPTSEMSPSIDL